MPSGQARWDVADHRDAVLVEDEALDATIAAITTMSAAGSRGAR